MVEVKDYRAVARRGERYWLIEVPEIGQTTQARTMGEAEMMTKDLIAVCLDVPIESVSVSLDWELPTSAKDHLLRAEELRKQASEANNAAATESRSAAVALHSMGLGLRDVGQLMGVSYQRAHQLVGKQS